MKADLLYTLLGPAAMMNNKHALSAQHRSLYLEPNRVTAKSTFGQVEVDVELGINEPCFLDTGTFLAVLNSMPVGEELKLTQKGEAISWKCGAATGKMATVGLDAFEAINRKPKKAAWPVQLELAEGLELGALSCDNNTLAAIGMYGIVIANSDNGVVVYSCDNVTVSACFALSDRIEFAPDVITLHPDAANILAATMKRGNKGKLEFFDGNIYYRSENTRLLISEDSPLEKDIGSLLSTYKDGKASKIITIPPKRIEAFVARVNAIAESRKDAHVTLRVQEGRIALSFSSATASSDEYYMAEGLGKVKEMAPVALKADKLARALRYTQGIDITYLDRGVVVLRGESPKFRYMISGSTSE